MQLFDFFMIHIEVLTYEPIEFDRHTDRSTYPMLIILSVQLLEVRLWSIRMLKLILH